jgi:hypothetical protein
MTFEPGCGTGIVGGTVVVCAAAREAVANSKTSTMGTTTRGFWCMRFSF